MRVTVFGVALLLAGGAWAEPIAAIRFQGNEVTRERILRQELTVREGDPLDPAALEESRQALMDLGLFKDVRAEVTGDGAAKTVTFVVEERYFILPLPRADGDLDEKSLSYGVELRLYNLGGLNQRLDIDYSHRRFADEDDATDRLFGIEYRYPRAFGTRFSVGVDLRLRDEEVESGQAADEGRYRRDTQSLSASVARWLTEEGPSRGWQARIAVGLERRDHTLVSGVPGPVEDGRLVQLAGGIAYRAVHDKRYWREGRAYGYDLALSDPLFGSDFSYQRHGLWWRRYRHLDNGSNVNTQIRLGFASGKGFGADAFALGDSDTVRGYAGGYVSGDVLLMGNAEYLFPVSGYPQMRAVLFADVGNVWADPGSLSPDLLAGAGLGLRWHVQSFVDVHLRVEVAHGFDAGTTETYAGTDVPF